MLPAYEVYAIKYAEHQRRASVNFLGGDPHDGPMPMDYFVWLVRGPSGSWLVDTGFDRKAAEERGRTLLRLPEEGLALLGESAASIRNVIVTHMHYDHAGTCTSFPAATFHLQDREMSYATGRYMGQRCMNHAYSVLDVLRLVEFVYAGRVTFHDGDTELAPGLQLCLIGGHTLGLQAVRVHTARGWVVLASDASHYYRNIEERRPFPIVLDVGKMVDGWSRLNALADSPDHVIPGHDPEVLRRYPAPTEALRGIVAALHRPPG
jgi:glyoxylase-like metal-dependent hydrolase (beta-lactamase superfamily II)